MVCTHLNTTTTLVHNLIRNFEAEGRSYDHIAGYLAAHLASVIARSPDEYRDESVRTLERLVQHTRPAV